jgi:hypothetical protein
MNHLFSFFYKESSETEKKPQPPTDNAYLEDSIDDYVDCSIVNNDEKLEKYGMLDLSSIDFSTHFVKVEHIPPIEQSSQKDKDTLHKRDDAENAICTHMLHADQLDSTISTRKLSQNEYVHPVHEIGASDDKQKDGCGVFARPSDEFDYQENGNCETSKLFENEKLEIEFEFNESQYTFEKEYFTLVGHDLDDSASSTESTQCRSKAFLDGGDRNGDNVSEIAESGAMPDDTSVRRGDETEPTTHATDNLYNSNSSADFTHRYRDTKRHRHIPIVFVQDTFNTENIVKNYMKNSAANVFFPDINPLGSVYDRAIQLFHEIKGEICFFGPRSQGPESDTDKTCSIYGMYPKWSREYPLHFVCMGYGGNTVRELLYLLMTRQIPKFDNTAEPGVASYYDTSQEYIASIVTIVSPLCGIDITPPVCDFYINKGILSDSLVLKYIGWSLMLSRKSASLQEYLNTQKMQYWNLPYSICMFLNRAKLCDALHNNVCFADLDTKNAENMYSERYRPVLSNASVPVLKIVTAYDHEFTSSNCVPMRSQRFFYGSSHIEKRYNCTSEFQCAPFEDAYIVLPPHIDPFDILDSPNFDEFFLQKTYEIHNILVRLVPVLK